MTPQERRIPHLIDGTRRMRIADGSGTNVQQVNQLLEARKQMEKMMKRWARARCRAPGPGDVGRRPRRSSRTTPSKKKKR